MTDRNEHFLRIAGHEIHVTEYGARNAEAVVMWHGFARTGADFLPLATELAKEWRVFCPDVVGRGLSGWAADAEAYGFDTYEEIAVGLCEVFGLNVIMWVGTSMGGALGIRAAGGRFRGRITHLVVNDIGPEVPDAAIDRIIAYAGTPPVFDAIADLEQFLRTAYRPFGYLTPAQWTQMAITSSRRLDDGRVTLHYDPRIVEHLVHRRDSYSLWDAWRAVTCKTLVLRGVQSDILSEDLAARMLEANPRAEMIDVPDTGHAPALNVPDQIAAVAAFLREPPLR